MANVELCATCLEVKKKKVNKKNIAVSSNTVWWSLWEDACLCELPPIEAVARLPCFSAQNHPRVCKVSEVCGVVSINQV